MTRAIVLACTLCLAGCGPSRVGAPAPAPPAGSPGDFVPPDLDVVVRLDLSRLRSGLASLASRDLATMTLPDVWLTEALEHASSAWVGLRPASRFGAMDGVVVLTGHFEGFEPRDSVFGPPLDLGGAWRRWDRPRPSERSTPAVVFVRDADLVLVGTYAEIDSLERVVERGHRGDALEAPARGAIAGAARVGPIVWSLRDASPALASALESAAAVTVSIDIVGGQVAADLAFECESDEGARALEPVLGRLLHGLADASAVARVLVSGARMSVAGSSVLVALRWPVDDLARLWQHEQAS